MFDPKTQSNLYKTMTNFVVTGWTNSFKIASQITSQNLTIASKMLQNTQETLSEAEPKKAKKKKETESQNSSFFPSPFEFFPQFKEAEKSSPFSMPFAPFAPFMMNFGKASDTPTDLGLSMASNFLEPAWNFTGPKNDTGFGLNFDPFEMWKPRSNIISQMQQMPWAYNPWINQLPWMKQSPWSFNQYFPFQASPFAQSFPMMTPMQMAMPQQQPPWQQMWPSSSSPYAIKGFMMFFTIPVENRSANDPVQALTETFTKLPFMKNPLMPWLK